MNWARIKLWLANLYGFCIAFPIIPISLGLIILGLLIFGGIKSCQSARQQKKIDDIKTNITIDQIEGNMLKNTANQIRQNINKIEGNSNKVNQALENVKKQNLDEFDGNYSEQRKRFCEKYPEGCL